MPVARQGLTRLRPSEPGFEPGFFRLESGSLAGLEIGLGKQDCHGQPEKMGENEMTP